ncbi:MAG: hypothetical protein U9O94_06570 [Nanoarchaeota archaeon]|nr:hypothetical protein [Nanoarchaeota archaeon]
MIWRSYCCDGNQNLDRGISKGKVKSSDLKMNQPLLKEKPKKSPIQCAINTYIGNYCYRKCFRHDNTLRECFAKFDKLAKEMGNVPITFKEFNSMMKNNEIKICKLPFEKRVKYVSWKRFEYYKWKDKDYWDMQDES